MHIERPYVYDVFISYRRSDGALAARRLRRRLLHLRFPRDLQVARAGPVTVYLDTIYEKAADDFFERTIKPALAASRNLIVIQTPDARKPRADGKPNWVEREIEYFRQLPQGANICVALADGAFGDPLPGKLSTELENVEIVDIRPSRLYMPGKYNASIIPILAHVHDIPAVDMPRLHRENERRTRSRLLAALTAAIVMITILATLLVWAIRSQKDAKARLEFAEDALAENLLDLATNALSQQPTAGDPAEALALAYAAEDTSPRPRSGELVTEALRELPYWRRLDLGRGDKLSVTDGDDHTMVTSDLHRVLYSPGIEGRTWLLRSVDGGSLATVERRSGEEIWNEGRSGGIAIVGVPQKGKSTGEHFRLLDLTGVRLKEIPLSLTYARAVACSKNAFPCFTLWLDGSIHYHQNGSDSPGKILGYARLGPDVKLTVSPAGNVVAVFTLNKLLVWSQERGAWRKIHLKTAPFQNIAALKMHWAASGDRAILTETEVFYGDAVAYAFKFSGEARMTPLQLIERGRKLSRLGFVEVNRTCDRLLVRYATKDRGSIELASIRWESGAPAIARRSVLQSMSEAEGWQLGSAAFSADERYAIYVCFRGGGDRSVTSWLQLVDFEREKFNQRFEIETVSVQGSAVSRVAFGSDGSRLIAWSDGVAATIFRLRTGPPPKTSLASVEQMSQILPDDVYARFTPQVIYSTDQRRVILRYASSDIRRYDLHTGEETQLRVLATSDLLDGDVEADSGATVLCTRDRLLRVSSQGVELVTLLPKGVVSCSVHDSFIFVQTQIGMQIYRQLSLRQIGTILWESSVVDWVGTSVDSGELSIYSKSTDTFRRWVGRPNQKGVVMFNVPRLVRLPTAPVGKGLHSNDRIGKRHWYVVRNILITSEFYEQFRAKLQLFDFDTGLPVTRYLPPAKGWPERIEHIPFGTLTPDGRFALSLRSECGGDEDAATCVASGVWPAKGGRPSIWSVTPSVGHVVATRTSANDLTGRLAALEGSRLSWIQVANGSVVASMDVGYFGSNDFTPPVAWPELNKDGGWKLPNSTAYVSLLSKIRLGGLRDASSITGARLGSVLESRMRRLEEK